MSATTSGAIKSLIESGGLALAAYRDLMPSDATFPCVVITEGISLVTDPSNARWDPSANPKQVREQAQVTLWQRWRDSKGKPAETYGLADALTDLLDGGYLPDSPTHTWGVIVRGAVRLVEQDSNLVQNSLTVEVVRDL